jgi:hypothetical protein
VRPLRRRRQPCVSPAGLTADCWQV